MTRILAARYTASNPCVKLASRSMQDELRSCPAVQAPPGPSDREAVGYEVTAGSSRLLRSRSASRRPGPSRSAGTGSCFPGMKTQVSGVLRGESACRPGSVPPLARGDGHLSRAAVAGSLVRSTREHRAGRPQALAQARALRREALLTLLRVGFTEPPQSPAALVVSYTTVSPLPRRPVRDGRRFAFCGTVPRVTPGRRYRPPCPVEPGPSSPAPKDPARPPGRLTRPPG
jgi:hypothetical protein